MHHEAELGRKRALMASLNGGLPQPTYSEAVLVRAARLLADLGDLWAKATPTVRAEVRVWDERIVGASLTRSGPASTGTGECPLVPDRG